MERICGVAIRLSDRMSATMPAPARHSDLISELNLCGAREFAHGEQGFVTDSGRYVTRWQAKRIAMRAEQMLKESPHDELFSEDVW